MTINKSIIKGLIILSLNVLVILNVNSQVEKTLHLMKYIPQSNYTNPANIPQCKFHMSVPGFSYVNTEFKAVGLRYKNIFRNSNDSTFITIDSIVKHTNDTNSFNFGFKQELFSMGLKVGKFYFSVNANQNFSFDYKYTGGLLRGLWNGNTSYIGQNIPMGMGFELMHYTDFGLGVAYKVTPDLTVGLRGKMFIGTMNLQTEKCEMNLYTAPNATSLTFGYNFVYKGSSPSVFNYILDNISLDSINFNTDSLIEYAKKDQKGLMDNKGYGVDLGLNYKLDKFNFGLSVLDIGSNITWKKNLRKYSSAYSQIKFDGFKAEDLYNKPDSIIDTLMNLIIDTVRYYKMDTTNQVSYKTTFYPKIFLTAVYNVTPKLQLGLMMYNHMIGNKFDFARSSYTLSVNKNFLGILSLTGTYTFMKYDYPKWGGGFAINVGPVQFYTIIPNVNDFMYPQNAQSISLLFGINMVLGYFKMNDDAQATY